MKQFPGKTSLILRNLKNFKDLKKNVAECKHFWNNAENSKKNETKSQKNYNNSKKSKEIKNFQ